MYTDPRKKSLLKLLTDKTEFNIYTEPKKKLYSALHVWKEFSKSQSLAGLRGIIRIADVATEYSSKIFLHFVS